MSKKAIRDKLALIETKQREDRKRTSRMKKCFEKGEYEYVAELCSFWQTEGEENVEARHKNMKTAISLATEAFKKVNKRSDIQAALIIYARFDDNRILLFDGQMTKEFLK